MTSAANPVAKFHLEIITRTTKIITTIALGNNEEEKEPIDIESTAQKLSWNYENAIGFK